MAHDISSKRLKVLAQDRGNCGTMLFHQENYSSIQQVVASCLDDSTADGILLDLGVSSMQVQAFFVLIKKQLTA